MIFQIKKKHKTIFNVKINEAKPILKLIHSILSHNNNPKKNIFADKTLCIKFINHEHFDSKNI